MLFQGHCQIWTKTDIEDGEINAIQEGLRCLIDPDANNRVIVLCADNQNAQKALAGGPTAKREYVKACLEDVNILRQKGCKIKGKCSPSHTGILDNERADTLAKEGTKDAPCQWTKKTLIWLRARPYHWCIEKWQNKYGLSKKLSRKPFAATASIPRRSAWAISRLQAGLTGIDPTAMRPPIPCACGLGPASSKHTLLDCQNELAKTVRKVLLDGHDGSTTWDSIRTNTYDARN